MEVVNWTPGTSVKTHFLQVYRHNQFSESQHDFRQVQVVTVVFVEYSMNFLRKGNLGLNDWFYYLIGIFIVILGYGILGQAPLLLVVYLYMDKYGLGLDALKRFEETTDFSVMHISNNLGFFLMVLIFIGARK